MQALQRHKLHSKNQGNRSSDTSCQMEDSTSDRFRNRNSIPISETEIKRAKTDAKYGKVAEPKVKLIYCFVIFLPNKVISTN